jgi:hypothetical protein
VAPPLPPVDDRDLDDLFAPVDDALADWDRANAAAGTADASAPATPDTDATNVDATQADLTQVDVTQVDATEVEATEPEVTEADTTPADPEPDVTEVVDPTERYPGREPE